MLSRIGVYLSVLLCASSALADNRVVGSPSDCCGQNVYRDCISRPSAVEPCRHGHVFDHNNEDSDLGHILKCLGVGCIGDNGLCTDDVPSGQTVACTKDVRSCAAQAGMALCQDPSAPDPMGTNNKCVVASESDPTFCPKFACRGGRIDTTDSDGDGLFDCWETEGVDVDGDGTIDVPLQTFGANPNHKDLFIEYDWCTRTPPRRSSVQNVKAAFAAAPIAAGGVPNPDGQPGIHLWLDTGNLTDPGADEGVLSCADGIDNDGDGLIDAADAKCLGRLHEAAAGAMGTCNDGIDNDHDMLVDALDPDCLVGDNLGGGNAIMCPLEGVPNLDSDSCDATLGPTNTCVASGVDSGSCAVSGVPCTPDSGFFTRLKSPNFDARRKLLFRYGVLHPPADGNAREDGGPVGSCSDHVENSPATADGADAADPVCAAGVEDGVVGGCFNHIDDRADGLIDGADPDCNARENGAGPGSCFDHIDNSADGADAADPQCAAQREDGGGPNSCFDGINNGNPFNLPFLGDTLTDAADPDCQHVEDGKAGATCYNGRDDGADLLADAADPNCAMQMEDMGGPGSCYDGKDNSGDGADAADPECFMLSENGKGPGTCYDTLDNVFDGVDGADPDCSFGGGWGDRDNFIVYNDDPGGGTLMHEIGHTLGLQHGGDVTNNCKPNYVSVMNYDNQVGINQFPGHGIEGNLATLREDGAGPNSCTDGIDNGGTGDGIDLLDPDCQSCNDGVDNDLDGLLDARDPDCLGLDVDNDGVPDQRILDYSPPRFPGGRANVLPSLIETQLTEAHALISIDLNGDGLQDTPTDPINMIVFKPRNAPGGQETAAGPATCSDGVDNDGDGLTDALDPGCIGRTQTSAIHGSDLNGDGIVDGIDWNSDGDASDVVIANIDSADPITGAPKACGLSPQLAGLGEGMPGTCANNLDDDGDGLMDAADPDCQLAGFDDWAHILLRTTASTGIATPSAVLTRREPTDQELRAAARSSRTTDLILEAGSSHSVVAADGGVTLQLVVENAWSVPAYGPLRLVIEGLPADATLQPAVSNCMRDGNKFVCYRGWLEGHRTWTTLLTFKLGDACGWLNTKLHASVSNGSGEEPTPADNAVDITVDGQGIWPAWKMCPSRAGTAPYAGPTTNTVSWSRNLLSPVRSSALVANDGNLFVTTSAGRVYALDPAGTVRWSTSVALLISGSAALTSNGLVVAASQTGSVSAYRQSDGTRQWQWTNAAIIEGSPVVGSSGRTYVGTGTGLLNGNGVVALNASGGIDWRIDLQDAVSSSPALGLDERIYVTTQGSLLTPGRLHAISRTGTKLWSTSLATSTRSSPALRGNRVYVGNENGQLLAIDATTGQIVWTFALSCAPLTNCAIRSSPSIDGAGHVFFGAQNGSVYALLDGGTSASLAWSFAASGSVSTPIVSANGIVYVGSSSGRWYALRATTGTEVFRVQTSAAVAATASLTATGQLLLGSDDGNLRAVGP